jgi:deoxyribonucleoside regulator
MQESMKKRIMSKWKDFDREQLIVDVAVLYYEEKKTQQEISAIVGKTRPTISKLLKEALDRRIVETRIHHPVHFDHTLEIQLEETFGLKEAKVFIWRKGDYEHLRRYLGIVGASEVHRLLHPGVSIGVTWGTTLQAIIDEMEEIPTDNARVVQLAGALGGRGQAYDAIALVQRLAEKLHGESYYLNAPFLVESAEMAESLLSNASNRRTIELGAECDTVLVGIGKLDPQMSTLYLGGHISLKELQALQKLNVIGDACGHPFDSDGKDAAEEFNSRVVSISRDNLRAVPTRLAVAGGTQKAAPILAGLLGGYMNQLVTDAATAEAVLELNQMRKGKLQRKAR